MVSSLVVGTNTYATLAEANTYLEDSSNAVAWAFLDDDTRKRALISAFRLFQKLTWNGTRTGGNAQVAAHPRIGLVDCDGITYDSATVADPVKYGQIELANAISVDSTIEAAANTGSNIKSLKAGSVGVDFFNSTDGSGGVLAARFPPQVMEYIRCFLSGSGAESSEAFGTDGETIFGADGGFERELPL